MSNFNYGKRLGANYIRNQTPNYDSYNNHHTDNLNYNNTFSEQNNTQLSVIQEETIEYEKTEHFLTVISSDRDRTMYPNVNHYRVDLPSEFKNIHSIELVQAVIPDQNDVTLEPYLLLNIDELDNIMTSTNKYISDSFAVLQLANPIATASFIYIDKRIHENVILTYKTPKASLARMTITITDYKGTPFDFGTDTTIPAETDKSLQNMFVFRIITLDKKRTELRHRNVY